MHELLESEHARTFVEGAEERGFVEPAEIEAFALEHDLGEEDAEQFQRELEAIGLEIRQPVEETEAKTEKPEEKAVEAQPQVLVGSADSRCSVPSPTTRGRSACRCTSSSASRSSAVRRAGSKSSLDVRRPSRSSPRRRDCRCSTSTRRWAPPRRRSR